MYNWLTRTRQGQIVSFLILLFLIASFIRSPHAPTTGEEAKKAAEAPKPPVPAPSLEPPAEPSAPAPKTGPAPMNLEKLISELTSFYKTRVAKARTQLTELKKPTVEKAKIESVWIVIQIKDSSLLQEAAKEILAEFEKDKLSESDDSPKAASLKEALESYERILAEYRDAAKNLHEARADLRTAARAAILKRSESWRKRALDLRAEIKTGEKALSELDRQVKSAREKIPDPPS